MKKIFFSISIIFLLSSCEPDHIQTVSHDPIPFPTNGVVVDIDSNIYTTVVLGSQEWMAENLRTSTYCNGEPIAQITDNSQWEVLVTAAWSNYENNDANDTIYGKLYNWYAVEDERNICPCGWHVPTDDEWSELLDYLGGETAGGRMKALSHWLYPNEGATNESEFSGLPGGLRYTYGDFYSLYYSGYWWSSTISNTSGYAWCCNLNTESYYVHLNTQNTGNGLSVRCIKD